MSSPLSTGGPPSESQTWQELEDVFAALGGLARSAAEPHEFYRTALDQSVRALGAAGGVVWFCAGGGPMQPIAFTGRVGIDSKRSDDARRAHEGLLSEAIAGGRVLSVAPHTVDEEHPAAANLTDHLLVLGPVHFVEQANVDAARERRITVAILELWMRKDASPATYRGAEQFVNVVCELAADFHAFHELRRLRTDEYHRSELLALGRLVHRELSLSATAYAVANEGRRVLGCGRLSVLVARGKSCKLLAASGVSRIERRSTAARGLRQVAEQVRRTDEPAHYADGECDALPPVAEAITRHVEESHARHVAAIPIRSPERPLADDAALDSRRQRRAQANRPQFVLIAEQFDAREGELRRDWLVEVAEVSTTALYNALAVDRLPLGWLLRPLGRAKEAIATHVTRTAAITLAVVGAIAALVLVPADFNIEATGAMQPTVRRDVFAPRSGVVDEVLVTHGANVEAGEPLVRMRDPSLELELKRVDGELETAQRQLDAVRSTRTNRAIRDTSPVDSYRLSAEERELEQKVTNARRELGLLKHEREQLVVASPIAGRVLTWDVGQQLLARPVERGEVLISVADLASPWQLELAVPDDRIGYVLAAQKDQSVPLAVRFRLGSEERTTHDGHIKEICQTADVLTDKSTTKPTPTILTKVALDSEDSLIFMGDELKPGVSARAQIECGRRSIGYVWLHDIWNAAIQWWQF